MQNIRRKQSQPYTHTSGFTAGTHKDDEGGGHQFENKLWLRFYFILSNNLGYVLLMFYLVKPTPEI